ncbi:hypothetical protein ALCH109712_15125 [Alkalicoccus chagannorensis]
MNGAAVHQYPNLYFFLGIWMVVGSAQLASLVTKQEEAALIQTNNLFYVVHASFLAGMSAVAATFAALIYFPVSVGAALITTTDTVRLPLSASVLAGNWAEWMAFLLVCSAAGTFLSSMYQLALKDGKCFWASLLFFPVVFTILFLTNISWSTLLMGLPIDLFYFPAAVVLFAGAMILSAAASPKEVR